MTGTDNKRRTLRQLAVTRAWFDPIAEKDPPRHAFRMDVAFREERLGGGEGDPVRFRVKLRRCEVVVVLPRGEDGLRIDLRTVVSNPTPATVAIERWPTASSEVSGSGQLGVGAAGATGSASLSSSAKRSRSVEAVT